MQQVNDYGTVDVSMSLEKRGRSIHTAEVDGYVVEDHVPAAAIRRLLAERPEAIGLAVPGMPSGSPGMGFPGSASEPYEAFLFGPTIRSFGRFLGPREI